MDVEVDTVNTDNDSSPGADEPKAKDWARLAMLPAGVLVLFSAFWLDGVPMTIQVLIAILGLGSGVAGALLSPLSDELRESPTMTALFIFAIAGFLVYPLDKAGVNPTFIIGMLLIGSGISLVFLIYGSFQTLQRVIERFN